MTTRPTFPAFVLACAALAPTAARAEPASPLGRWITASGNLEVAIAPCGAALCGTVTRVLANRSMSPGGAPMDAVDKRPALDLRLMSGFTAIEHAEDGSPSTWDGELYNRENGKTYRCRMSLGRDAETNGALVVRPYVGLPLFGQTQLWRRAGTDASATPAR